MLRVLVVLAAVLAVSIMLAKTLDEGEGYGASLGEACARSGASPDECVRACMKRGSSERCIEAFSSHSGGRND